MINCYVRDRCEQKTSARSGCRTYWHLLQVLLLGLALSTGAWGREVKPQVLRVCIADENVPPYTSLKSPEALGQTTLREAARRQGWQVQFSVRPWRRCRAETASGIFQAIFPLAPTVENLQLLKFPQHQGKPNLALMLGDMRILAVRVQGNAANWDGQRFTGLTGPVLYLSGVNTLDIYFANKSQASDSSARTAVSMGHMLLAQRSNIAVDLEDRILHLLEQDEFRGRLEVLPRPVLSAPVFLAVSPSLYANSPQAVEQLWQDMTRLFHAAIAQRAKAL